MVRQRPPQDEEPWLKRVLETLKAGLEVLRLIGEIFS